MGREMLKRPSCPFCGDFINRPRELATRRPGEMPVGSCTCGAVYACDITGHNLGAAMIEALVFGCNMDWDLAWDLLPEEDYLEKQVEHYDIVNHIIVPGGVFEARKIAGVLYFIRLHDDVLEVTADGVQKMLTRAKPVTPEGPTRSKKQILLSKREVELFVRSFRPEPIVEIARKDRRIIRNLQRLLYTPDTAFRSRAAEILGMAAAVIADQDPETISKLLQRLFTAITDTAASSWGSFEAIAEIISHRAELFGGYIPQLFSFLGDETRRADCLRAVGTIAKARPDLLRKHTFHFIPFLDDPAASVRGYAAWLLGNLGASEARQDLEKLLDDDHPLELYENGTLEEKKVGQIAKEAIERL